MTIISADCGNGRYKAVINGARPFDMPSYILSAPSNLERPSAGYVRYIRGDRADLTGHAWLSGDTAYEQAPSNYDAVNRDALGKLDKALQMLLGMLSYTTPRSQDISLVCSIHLMELAEEVQARLEGSHTVLFNQDDTEHTLTIEVLKVCPEGFGAVVEHGLTDGKNIVTDLGNGTLITTVYGARGRIVDRDVQPGGFEDLVSRIARDSELVVQLGEQGNPDRIRRAFEDNTYTYGNMGVSLVPLVRRHITPWAQATIAKSLTFARTHQADANNAIAIGGGVTLKAVKDLFNLHHITPSNDPVFCNAKGLYKLAQRLAA